MIVSIDTLKTHLTHIYGKLGAQDRTRPIVAAYEGVLGVQDQ
jgi:DNA-binding CsgD family transcriptional regulator